MSSSPATTPSYGVVIPVKPPAMAKSRLAPLGDHLRRDLVAAFAVDTITAVTECPLVRLTIVVTDDHAFAAGLSDLGVTVIPDGATDNLNASLEAAGAEVARHDPSLRIVALCADLPALRTDELTRALLAADPDRMSFVADANGSGTTTVVAPNLEEFRPRFGPESRKAHLDVGAQEIVLSDIPGLRSDIDTPDDLAAAARLGLGLRTSYLTTAYNL